MRLRSWRYLILQMVAAYGRITWLEVRGTLAIGWPAGSCSDHTPFARIGQQALVTVKGHLMNNIIYIVGVIVIIVAILSFLGLR